MALRPEPEDILDVVNDLRRRVRDLETARSATRTAINKGATTVVDDNGTVIVRIGLLSDNTYGIEVLRANGTYGKIVV